MAAKRSATKRSARQAKSDLSVSYNEFKEHEGQRYTGMKIGRSHKWYYDQGEWKERKIMFLRSVLADLEKHTDRDGAAIAAAETPGARKRRQARTPHAIGRHAAGQRRGVSRASAQRDVRRATRMHRGNIRH